ncbi:PEP-CTERM sorting domain-containing protein [Falsiroseomonas bella]|nr:PEP-CTERM sorting domain-containing protein [Falsiroseomonas bella]
MKKSSLLGIAAAALLGVGQAQAGSFDFTTLGAENTALATSVVVGGVTAEGFNNNLSTPANLWLRNVTNDHGLGVCSEGASACRSGGGDVNELDNDGSNEFIRLTLPTGELWETLWVSSLDGGGSGGSEEGRLQWSNDPTFGSVIGSANFAYTGGSVEKEILASIAGFDTSAKYLLFSHPGSVGDDNDYLVWKGTTVADPNFIPAPEPASLTLLGAGIFAMGLARRRRR